MHVGAVCRRGCQVPKSPAEELEAVRLELDHLASRRSGSGLSAADERRYRQLTIRELELLVALERRQAPDDRGRGDLKSATPGRNQ